MADEINSFAIFTNSRIQCISCNEVIIEVNYDTYKQCGCSNAQSYLCSDCWGNNKFDNLYEKEFCNCGDVCEEYHSYQNNPDAHPDEHPKPLTYGVNNDDHTKSCLIPLYIDIGMVDIKIIKRKMKFMVNICQIINFDMIVNVSNIVINNINNKYNINFNLCVSNKGNTLWF